MKSKIFIVLIFIINGLCLAQQNTFNKEAELKKFVERRGKVEETSPNIYKLTYRDGSQRVFNFNQTEKLNEIDNGIDTTIINVWEIDTTKFAGMFKFWQKVEVANSYWMPLPVEDLNKNGEPELYGYTDVVHPNFAGPVKIFERDFSGVYNQIFNFDSETMFVQGMGDIHQTGGKDIFLFMIEVTDTLINSYNAVYKSDSSDILPTTFDFKFYYDNQFQINDMTFGDFDINKITDCAFTSGDDGGIPRIILGEFRDSINNFVPVFEQVTEGECPSGFAIGDFDQDRKTELVSSTGNGNIYIIENNNENQYSLVSQFLFPYLAAYMQTVTNDIDGNGKPEFWIGGQNLLDGITTYQCYESDSDNSYHPIARIELRYSVSLGTNYIQAADIDDDGKEELIISSGNNIFILKFVGSSGEHIYKLLYAKLGEATQINAEFYPVAIADLDGDEKKDLLLPFRKFVEPIEYAFSYILRKSNTTGVENENSQIFQDTFISSYPNPFNATSTISFQLNETSKVQIKIFNTLGKEITTLLEKDLTPNSYTISWEAINKNGDPLPSGVYLIVLQTKNSIKSIKTILLK
ncbi:MAG: T9SS type A sorting domain-containing protein [Ignavibacteriales bacterium]|nr:T9SS type A sorting domain-containing protein [Ignavibacteriales bacterium]